MCDSSSFKAQEHNPLKPLKLLPRSSHVDSARNKMIFKDGLKLKAVLENKELK